jgi:hypothetical protein
MSYANAVAIHEAAHAVAFMAYGLPFKEIVTGRNGGHVGTYREQIAQLSV